MAKCFFFTTSLNFGNIFSSESISPESFYPKRGFGFDYFENPFPNIKDFIILFEEFPLIDLPISNEIDLYKIVLELEISGLQFEKSNIEGVWLCPVSIQLNTSVLKGIYFNSIEEKNRVIAKAESSKALKMLFKYAPYILTETSLKKTPYEISEINLPKNNIINICIEQDRLFNSFKGFLYGLLGGYSNQKSADEVAYTKSLQSIKNEFALLKNNLAHNSFSRFSKDKGYKNQSDNSYDYYSASETYNNLRKLIDNSERLFISYIDTIGVVDYVEEFIKNVVFQNYSKNISSDHIEGALQLAKKMRGFEKSLERDARNWFWEQNQNSPYILYEVLKSSVQGYRETSNKEKQDDYGSDILKAIFKLEKYAEGILLQKAQISPVIDFTFIDYQDSQVKLSLTLNKDDIFEPLINMVLQNTKRNKGKISDQQLIPIVEKAGEIFKEGQGKKSHLYRYLTKQEGFYIEKAETPVVFKNFTAFIFNPNDIDKLKKYIEEKSIPDPHYAFSFFGAFNGFASLSKDFTKPLVANEIFQNTLDTYLQRIQNKISQIETFFHPEKLHEETEIGLSYEEIMDKAISSLSSIEIVKEPEFNQDVIKIDLQEFKNQIIYKAKQEKILKPEVLEEFNKNLDASLMEIDRILGGLPYKGQLEFINRRLFLLFTSKYKVKNLGEKKLSKLFGAN